MPPKVLKDNVTQLDDKTKTKIENAYVRKQVAPDEAANKIGKAVRSTVKLDAKNLDEFGEWHRELSPKLHKRTRLLSRYV